MKHELSDFGYRNVGEWGDFYRWKDKREREWAHGKILCKARWRNLAYRKAEGIQNDENYKSKIKGEKWI